MMLGHDFLGLAKFDMKQTISAFPVGWAVGVFAREFGDVMPHLEQLLQTSKVPALRVQCWYAPGSHPIAPINFLQKELPRWEALKLKYPLLKVYVSHSCEYSEKDVHKIQARVDLVKQLCPSCIVVQTPMHSPVIPGFLVEQHAAVAHNSQMCSTDGNEIMQMDALGWIAKNKNAEICFLWGARYNLREVETPEHPTPPPLQRTAFPDAKYIQGITRLGQPMGTAPTPNFQWQPLTLPQVYKVYGEDYPGTDTRSNKPVLLLPAKTPTVDLVASNGQRVCTFPLYRDSNPHTLERYYSGWPHGPNLYGYEIAALALKLSGSEFVWVRQNGKNYGPVHPAFRTQPYQH